MTLPEERDRTQVETDPPAGDTPTSPEGDTPISPVDATVKAILEHPDFQGALQGVKDRRIARSEKRLDNVEAVIGQLNLTPEQQAAYDQISRDQKVDQIYNAVFGDPEPTTPASSPAPSGGGQPTETRKSVNIMEAYKSAGFDPNSLTLEDIEFAEGFSDPVSLSNALLKKAAAARSSQPPPSAATSPPAGGGVSAQPTGDRKLWAEYNDKLSKIPPGRNKIDRVLELKKEYRQKGLNIV